MSSKSTSVSLNELLSYEESRAPEAVAVMGAKIEAKGEDNLSDSEELFHLVHLFLKNIQDGGFAQFFHRHGASAKELANALLEIGATTMHVTLRRAMSVFPGGDVPREEDEVERLLELVDGEDELWEELDQDYQETKPIEVEKCLVTFISDNRIDFS